MAHIQENIVQLCSNLNEFRIAEKYTDIVVRCENENFKCHRIILALASDFFDRMFSGDFKEAGEDSVELKETSNRIFKDVLQFIYTGDVKICHQNVVGMLEASEFFILPGMRNLCIQFIQQNKMNVRNTIASFTLACKTNQQVLVEILSQDIARQLRIFSFASSFLELSFQEFNTIMNKYTLFPTKNDHVLIATAIKWIFHHEENRRQYFNKFVGMIQDLNKVRFEIMYLFSQSSDLMSDASNNTNKLVSLSPDICAALTHKVTNNESMQDLDVLEAPRTVKDNVATMAAKKSLYVYVKYAEEKLMRVFNIKENNRCTLVSEIPINCADQWMKIVASDNRNYLYSLHYIRRNPTRAKDCGQSFYAHTSVNMSSTFCLKSPPVIFDDVSLCSSQNKIYVYNQTLSQQIPTANSSNFSIFNAEEVSRGIYVYIAEVDNWFPVAAMKEQMEDSCMTVHENILYLIGGSKPNNCSAASKIVQTYDHRCGKWLGARETHEYFVGADCSVMDSRIYVCGGNSTRCTEFYEPRTISWTVSTNSVLPKSVIHHQLNTYANKLWLFENYTDEGIPSNDLSILTCPALEQWTNSSPILTEASRKTTGVTTGTILDSVVFEY